MLVYTACGGESSVHQHNELISGQFAFECHLQQQTTTDSENK